MEGFCVEYGRMPGSSPLQDIGPLGLPADRATDRVVQSRATEEAEGTGLDGGR